MKSKIKNIDKCSRLFEVEVPAQDVERTVQEVYKEIQKSARIPGFRVGYAPQDVLEKYHSKDVEEEVLRRLIPEGCRQAIKQHNLDAVTFPEVSDVVFDNKSKLSFKARVEIRPEIKPKNYKGIKVKKHSIKLNPNEVQDTLKRLQEMNAQFVPVGEKRQVEKKDYVICDIEAFVDDKPISKKQKNMWVIADKDSSMLGVGEQIIGMDIGQTKDIDVKLPDNYPDKKFAGKLAKFKVSINEIKIKKLPEINDEFAKDLGKENLKALEEELGTQLLERKESQEKVNLENQILDNLLKEYKFFVPQSMIKRQLDVLMNQAEQDLLSKGLNKDKVSEKKKELEPKLKEDAVNKIKIYFLLDEIANLENINVTADDVEKKFASLAEISARSIDYVKDYYEKNNLMDGMKEQLREEKTLDWLVSVASVVEEK